MKRPLGSFVRAHPTATEPEGRRQSPCLTPRIPLARPPSNVDASTREQERESLRRFFPVTSADGDCLRTEAEMKRPLRSFVRAHPTATEREGRRQSPA
ncbi:hypothetical protein SKAU_G00277440 [Synaphobranchus kaupii]|uniref:Uncharacterized protein n=1 Tax=Synaphobranchus kaupii TaxID=118154 RepID=A0A9Q1INP0_SYNKA|nr:hypothetical protein SKAU_G00277440 [Synaphobranchus kaupii]